MRRHDFGYFFHEGVVNLFSHGFMSFAAVGITVACLLVMGTFSLVAYNVNEQLRQLESENEILAFVDDTLTEAQGRSLQSAVEAGPNVRSHHARGGVRDLREKVRGEIRPRRSGPGDPARPLCH